MTQARQHTLVDVREPSSTRTTRIDGAVLIPLRQVPFEDRLDPLPKDRPVVVHCKSGGRSARAVARSCAAAASIAHNLTGGIRAWRASQP